ncbi:MAG: hypothetical protein KDA85_10390 [Planctomycetaceae bacterium]|nr:hypothetical protein [Planctomycetaceae bacterium]
MDDREFPSARKLEFNAAKACTALIEGKIRPLMAWQHMRQATRLTMDIKKKRQRRRRTAQVAARQHEKSDYPDSCGLSARQSAKGGVQIW